MNRLEKIAGISALALSFASLASAANTAGAESIAKYRSKFGTDKVDVVYYEDTCRRLTRMGYCPLRSEMIFEVKYDEERYDISPRAAYRYCTEDAKVKLFDDVNSVGHALLRNVFVIEAKTSEMGVEKDGKKCISGYFYEITPKIALAKK